MNCASCQEGPLQWMELDRVGVDRGSGCLGDSLDFKELDQRIAVPGHPRVPRRRASILDAFFPWLGIHPASSKVRP